MTDATRPTDDEVREVLAPFARFMDARQGLREADDGSFASTIIHGGTGDPKNGIPCDQTKLTIGDLRRAKALLDRLTTPQPHIAAEPGEVERKDLLARIDAEVERITGWHPAKDILRDCRRVLTLPEPRAAGEGALADDRTIRELGFAIKDAVNEAWPAEKRDRVARAALKCIALRHRFASPQTAGEVDLRGALIEAGRAAGAGLSDEVSNDFLLHVPGEVKARVASLTAERDAALVRCEEMRGAGEALRKEAALLLQNSEGCAANHYGNDHELFGMPAWLADSRARIEEASAILARAALGSGGGG